MGTRLASTFLIDTCQGTEAIKCMVDQFDDDDDDDDRAYDTETFKRMPKLKFLKIARYVDLRGSFEHIFQNLRWFHWYRCPLETLPFDFFPKKLVILELPWSNIRRWNLTKDLTNLKILDLSCSVELIAIPDFSRFPCLEKIDLKECWKLEKVDTTIGDLKNLVSLSLLHCTSLRCLPDSICKLTALQSLDIRDCDSLKALPEEIGNMKSLTSLVVGFTRLPDSIIYLTKLVELELNVRRLPDLSNFKRLERLQLYCSDLTEIEGLGELTSIRELDLKGCRSIKRLPNLSNLKQLEDLKLIDCRSLTEIEGMEGLTSITCLNLEGCTSIKSLSNLSNLKHLKELKLTNCPSLTEIESLEGLASITCLNLEGCTSIKSLSNLSNLKHLKELKLTNCRSLTEIEGLEGLASIKKIHMRGCDSTIVLNALTVSLFQRYLEFGNKIEISADRVDTPNWMKYLGLGCTELSTNFPSHNFLGLLLYFGCDFPERNGYVSHQGSYAINDERNYCNGMDGSLLVIVPREYLIATSGSCDDNVPCRVAAKCNLHLTLNFNIAVYPLYKLPQTSYASTNSLTK